MTKALIVTRQRSTVENESVTHKETDLDLPGNRRWLMSHIRWAAKFGAEITIRPL